MPISKILTPLIELWKYLTSLTPNQKVTVFSSTLLIASCWFAFYTNEENKLLRNEIKSDTKEYASSTNSLTNDCITQRLECENRMRLMEEAYRRVDAERRDRQEIELKSKLKEFEKKIETAEALNRKTNSLQIENNELEKNTSKL